MATNTTSFRERFRPQRETIQLAAIVINLELAIVLGYILLIQPQFGVAFDSLLDWRQVLYPFVWINVALWAVWRTSPAPTTGRRRLLAGAIAGGYFLLLSYAGGLFGIGGHNHGQEVAAFDLVLSLPPGWSPALLYQGELLQLTLLPYKIVGYLALAYLVYATVIDAAGSAVPGVLGLLSCISCTWPVLASVATSIFGGASALAVATTGYAYGLSTVIFVATVALLYWRPTLR